MLLFYVQSSRLADMPESMSAPRKGTQTCLLLSGAHRATVTEERFFCYTRGLFEKIIEETFCFLDYFLYLCRVKERWF